MSSRLRADADMIEAMVPEEIRRFLKDEDAHFRLTKTFMKEGRPTMISVGQAVSGRLEIVEVKRYHDDPEPGKPGVLVIRGFSTYIRTSPVVRVLDSTEDTVRFETEGGEYLLERLKDE